MEGDWYMAVEITVIVKDSERTYKHKTLEYGEVCLEPINGIIKAKIDEAVKSFNGEPEDVIIKTSMVWK